jgi:hypothetical protein
MITIYDDSHTNNVNDDSSDGVYCIGNDDYDCDDNNDNDIYGCDCNENDGNDYMMITMFMVLMLMVITMAMIVTKMITII